MDAEEDEGVEMKNNLQEIQNLQEMLEVSDDFKDLDTKDPVAVKRFVNDLRTNNMKKKRLSEAEKLSEQE